MSADLDPAAVAFALAQLRAEGDEHAAAELLHLIGGGDEEGAGEDESDDASAPEPERKAFPYERESRMAALVAKALGEDAS